MSERHTSTARRTAALRNRRGSAIILVIVMTVALGALALSAIFLGSSSTVLTKAHDREREYRFAAEAALAIGRSRLSQDASLVLDDSAAMPLLTNAKLKDASGADLPGVKVNLWLARSGSKTGQHGLYASVIAEAVDANAGGARFVRRLELMEENFARFLDWSNQESQAMCLGPGEVMNGPVWSNQIIRACGGRFKDSVATAGTVTSNNGSVFDVPFKTNQPRMELPSLERLGRLAGYAASGGFAFNAPNNGAATNAKMRIQFVWWDLDGDSTAVGDNDEGFFMVFEGQHANRIRADYRQASDNDVRNDQCGDWHIINGVPQFFPVSVHTNGGWLESTLNALSTAPGAPAGYRNREYSGWTNSGQVTAHMNANRKTIMEGGRTNLTATGPTGRRTATDQTPRCFPAGDPHLAAVERDYPSSPYTTAQRRVGGRADSVWTFTPEGSNGEWLPWPGAPILWSTFTNPPPAEIRDYLFPLDRGLNPGTKGVIYVNGTTAISGVLNGRVTVYATGDVTFIDDITYAVDPSSDESDDMLGVIAAGDITIADNGINTPQDPNDGGDDGNTWMDDNTHFYLHGVLLSLKKFEPERFTTGPNNMSICNGYVIGRGCLYQVGGAIVKVREATYTTAYRGFMEVRDYDRRMSRDSPPYFPTTGRYFDNRFYEVDPMGFDIDEYLRRIGQQGGP